MAARKRSQSPVPPRARLAYDACLNAGSTAGVCALPPKIGVPSRNLTSNLEFRTLLLFVLSYGDEASNPRPVSFTG